MKQTQETKCWLPEGRGWEAGEIDEGNEEAQTSS